MSYREGLSPLKNSFAAFGDTYSGCQAPVYWRFLSNAGLPIDSTTTFSTGCTVPTASLSSYPRYPSGGTKKGAPWSRKVESPDRQGAPDGRGRWERCTSE